MTFTVTYRGRDGALRREAIEAAGRAACVAECRRRAIVPTAIQAKGVVGRSAVSPVTSGTRRRAGHLFTWLAAALLAAVAGGAWWWFGRAGEQPLPAEPSAKPEAVAPPRKPAARRPVPVRETKQLPKEAQSKPIDNGGAPSGTLPRPVGTADTGTTEEGKAEADISPLSRPSAFRSGTEQVMAWIFMCPVGKMPPMLPTLPEEELARIGEILDSPNLIQEDDAERIAEAKETVAYAKQELKAFLDGGGRVQDFLKHYHAILLKAHREREEARMVVEDFDKSDPELSGRFRSKVNGMLRNEGIVELEGDGEDDGPQENGGKSQTQGVK